MNGSEFQEIWRYLDTLVERIEKLEEEIEKLRDADVPQACEKSEEGE